ncbi:DNA-binding response OmpR family regulator [Azospirillum fermentarium]|uniref:response regulator transcription factor n=1 Tax=Azospirillum fermentarium TaxID=1233114 RepID=UPI002226DAF9|nr:response regulator transcription factor [Azospirillum fermentarium]MCW2248646.1 DNA-binding response OmpR family regulator [Azospirillum fermentarium]
MFSVAVVEDESALLRTICRFLGKVGFSVTGYPDAESFLASHGEKPFDVVVLDVNLPGQDGFETAAQVRDLSPSVGIVILTARSDVDDRVTGLLNGADNYLSKPLHLTELHVVIQNLTRRIALERAAEGGVPCGPPPAAPAGDAPATPKRQPLNGWRLDEQDWSLIAPTGAAVSLTASEFRIMQALFRAPGRQVSREAIMTTLGKKLEQESDRRIDNLLSLLRRKVREETGVLLPVKSIRSSGYTFTGISVNQIAGKP